MSCNRQRNQGRQSESDEKSQEECDRPGLGGEEVPPPQGLGPQRGGALSPTPPLQSMWVLALSARWLPEGMIY